MLKFHKISLITAIAIQTGLYAEDSVKLSQIEVSKTAIELQNIDSAKVSIRNTEILRDILRDIPGVYVGGTSSYNQKIYMRGMNERGLNITVDGARQRGSMYHHAGDIIIDTDLLKRIEVSTGVGSVVQNSGALGGSVAFKTVSASDMLDDGQSFGAKLKGSYNSNDKRFSESLMVYGRAFDSLDILGYIKNNNYKFGKDGRGFEIGGKGNDLSYLLKAEYNFLDYHKLGISTEHVMFKGDYPVKPEFGGSVGIDMGTLKTGDREQPIAPQKLKRDTHRIYYSYALNEIIDLDINAYYTERSLVRDKLPTWENVNRDAPKFTGRNLIDIGVKTYGASILNKTRLHQGDLEHNLKYGAEFYEMKSYQNKFISLIANPDHTISQKAPNITVPGDKADSYSIYLEDSMKIGGFSVAPGVRFDYYTLDTLDVYPDRAKHDWHNISPAVRVDYEFDNGIGIFANYAKVFRGPEPLEAIRLTEDNAKKFKQSDKLDPETGDSYETGFTYRYDYNDDYNLNLIAKYFYTDYSNLINEYARSIAGETYVTRVNAGAAISSGFEVSIKEQLENWGFGIGYTHQTTNYKSKVLNTKGAEFPGTVLGWSSMGDKYTVNTDYYIPYVNTLVGYNMIFFKSRTIDGVKKPSYATHDIYATYLPKGALKGFEVNLGIYNLFDKAYYSHSQRNTTREAIFDWEPGRAIRASMSYKF